MEIIAVSVSLPFDLLIAALLRVSVRLSCRTRSRPLVLKDNVDSALCSGFMRYKCLL